MPQDKKYFDSAEWAMNKEAAGKKGPQGPGGVGAGAGLAPGPGAPASAPDGDVLPPKLEPSEKVASRRVSHLDGSPDGPKS